MWHSDGLYRIRHVHASVQQGRRGRLQVQTCAPPHRRAGHLSRLCPAKSPPGQLLAPSLPGVCMIARVSKSAIPLCITTLNASDLEWRCSVWQLINEGAVGQFFASGPSAPRSFGCAPEPGHVHFGRIEADQLASRYGRHSVRLQLSGDIPVRLGIQDVKRHAIAPGDAPNADSRQQYGFLSSKGTLVVCLREAGPRRTIQPCHEHASPGFETRAWALSARSWSGRIPSWLDVATA